MEWSSFDLRELGQAEYARYHALMAAEKRARVDRYRFAEDRRWSVAAEMLARRAVAARCGVPEEDVVFAEAENGKPYAVGLDVEFSLSHADGLVVFAVDDRPVGIDVERVHPFDLRAARRVCTAAELQYIFGRAPGPEDFRRTEDPAVLEHFYRVWTRREAWGKCSGAGVFAGAGEPLPETGFRSFTLGEYVISVYQAP